MGTRLKDKIAIVTGGSSGFGRSIAVAFAAEGAKVVVGDLQAEPSKGDFEAAPDLTTVDEIKRAGGDAAFFKCDVTKLSDVTALVGQTVDRYGRLDVMMNNAGIYRGGKLAHEFTEEDLDACWTVNVKGTWFGCQAAINQFLNQAGGGNIINLVSTAGLNAGISGLQPRHRPALFTTLQRLTKYRVSVSILDDVDNE